MLFPLERQVLVSFRELEIFHLLSNVLCNDTMNLNAALFQKSFILGERTSFSSIPSA